MIRLFFSLVASIGLIVPSSSAVREHTASPAAAQALFESSLQRNFYEVERKRYPCSSYEGENHLRAYYRYDSRMSKAEARESVKTIQATFEEMAQLYWQESRKTLVLKVEATSPYRDSTCRPRVRLFPSEVNSEGKFAKSLAQLQDEGVEIAPRNVLAVYFTNLPTDEEHKWCGRAFTSDEGWVSPESPVNFGGRWAEVRLSCWTVSTVTHEVTHLLGAVAPDSPNSNGKGHCVDEEDIMCYAEFDVPTQEICASRPLRLDCGRDDYFSLDPKPGSYLANHWNLRNSSFFLGGGPAPEATRKPLLDLDRLTCKDNVIRWPADPQVGGWTLHGYFQDPSGKQRIERQRVPVTDNAYQSVTFTPRDGENLWTFNIEADNRIGRVHYTLYCSQQSGQASIAPTMKIESSPFHHDWTHR